MSTIDNNIQSPIHVQPSLAVDSGAQPSVAGASFSQVMAQTNLSSPASWVTTAEKALAARPSIKDFMDKTGANFQDTSELVYGVVGSNTDVRDWSAILASADPVTAARQATGAMYGRTDTPLRTDVAYLSAADTVAKDGNFAVRLLKDETNKVLDQGVKLVDAQGLILRDAGSSAESMARNAWLFGFDTAPLANLASAATTLSPQLGQAVQAVQAVQMVQPLQVLAVEQAAQQVEPPAVNTVLATTEAAPTLAQLIDQVSAPQNYVDTSTYLQSLFGANSA